jgi:hypothetical protein
MRILPLIILALALTSCCRGGWTIRHTEALTFDRTCHCHANPEPKDLP